MNSKTLLFTLWLLVLLFSGASFGGEPVENLPGYVDFGSLEEFRDSEESVEVTIKEPLLSIITKAARKDNPELYKLLSGLKLIQVYTFSLKELKSEVFEERAARIALNLQKSGWERIVKAKEQKEKAEIYIKPVEGKIAGLVVLAIEYKREIAFVNIVGRIDLDSLDKLSSEFHLPGLDSLNLKDGGGK